MPAKGVGKPAAERWANEACQSEDRAEEPLIATALLGGVEVTNGCKGNGEERTSAKPLNATEDDQLLNVLRETRKNGSEQEESNSGQEKRLTAVHVGKLAVDRHRYRARKQVDRNDPGVQIGAAQISDDLWERGADDRLVQRAQEEGKHDRDDDSLLGAF